MSNAYFQFKQFTVWHDRCAMKVGTDGVLLGAWASATQVSNILDVGTGSGLIALILAQRFTEAHVMGIEIDANASQQARENFSISPWANRLEAVNADFRSYETPLRFDLIVSNPPYFVDALRPPVDERSLARHASGLNYETLFRHSRELLSEEGKLCVIIPAEVEQLAIDTAFRYGLHPDRKLRVFTKQGKPLRRLLLSFCAQITPCEVEDLYLMNADGTYTDAYRQLTEELYLKL